MVKILEKMLEVETEARQIVENAKVEANTIRKKAREDAKQLVVDGKKGIQQQIQQEITKIEEEAAAQKKAILQDMENHLTKVEQGARKNFDSTVDRVLTTLLEL